jgi:hypothetical protein
MTTTLDRLRAEYEALTEVYVTAARLRQFPVPFDAHYELVGAVDRCRSVLEPPVDELAARREAEKNARTNAAFQKLLQIGTVVAAKIANGEPERPSMPDQAAGWQAHVDAYPREEFLATFRGAHDALHRLWTEAVGKEGYDKALWREIDNALARFARDAAEKVGISRSEPLL